MIYTAIVEDNKRDAERLLSFQERYGQEHKLVQQCQWFSDAEKFLKSDTRRFDIVFMDIELPGMSGMEAAEKMRQSNPDIILIFITNLAQYVMKGYQVDALDYVLKPIQYPAFDLKFQKALTLCGQTKKTEYMVISANEGVFRMDAADVQYIEIYQHHIQYGTTKGIYNGYGTLKKIEDMLPQGYFFRCNNHTIAGLNHVQGILQNGDVQVGNRTFEVARTKRKELVDVLHQYYFGQ